jgi:hypothetical protein
MIAKHLLDIFILFVWMVVIGLAMMGWGEMLRHWLKFEPVEGSSNEATATQVLCDIWLGICLCITLTELLHFLVAINWLVSLGVLGSGLTYSVARGKLRRSQRLLFAPSTKAPSLTQGLYIFAALAVLFTWASAAMVGPTNYDSGLYHFSSIKWLNEDSVAYGIANLHSRLAYNQSYFALIALLNFSPFYEQAYAGTGVFLFILTTATCIQLIRHTSLGSILMLSSLLVLTGSFITKASSPTPDMAVGLFQVVIFFMLFNVLLVPARRYCLLPYLLILCVTALTIKLSMVAFCAATVLVASPHFRTLIKANRAVAWRLVCFCVLIFGIHALRGYALSGVPFYPSTFGGLWGLPYTPSPARILSEANSIFSWARLPIAPADAVLSNWAWLEPWLRAVPTRFWVLLGLAATLLAANLLLAMSARLRPLKAAYLLYAPLVLSFVFWFFTAPDVRFLGLIPELTVLLGCWIFSTALSQPFVQQLRRHWKVYRVSVFIVLSTVGALLLLYILKIKTGLGLAQYFYISDLLFGLSQIGIDASFFGVTLAGLLLLGYQFRFHICSARAGLSAPQEPKTTAHLSHHHVKIRMGHYFLTVIFLGAMIMYVANLSQFKHEALSGWASVPTEPYDQEQLNSGLRVNVPKSNDLCWQTPLPCTTRQYFSPQLEVITLSPDFIGLPTIQIFRNKP